MGGEGSGTTSIHEENRFEAHVELQDVRGEKFEVHSNFIRHS